MLRRALRGSISISVFTRNWYHRFGNPHLVESQSQFVSTSVVKNWDRSLSLTASRNESGITQTDNVLDNVAYERVCAETLDALSDYFDELIEQANHLSGSDVSYGDGVLTIKLGTAHGTYVINRQTPNRQIWLSSPTSGPKRYDFVGPATAQHGKWIYKHTNESLHELLQKELPSILKQNVDFLQLPFGS